MVFCLSCSTGLLWHYFIGLVRLCCVVVSMLSYKIRGPVFESKAVACSSVSCLSFLYGLIDEMDIKGSLEKANCWNLVVTCPLTWGNGLVQTACSRTKEMEITTKALCSYSVCL